MLINCTAHPAAKWSLVQRAALNHFLTVDIGFPNVPASAGKDEVLEIIKKTFQKILDYRRQYESDPDGDGFQVVCQGEAAVQSAIHSLCFRHGIKCFVATTERVSVEEVQPDGTTIKVNQFQFCQFRNVNDFFFASGFLSFNFTT